MVVSRALTTGRAGFESEMHRLLASLTDVAGLATRVAFQ